MQTSRGCSCLRCTNQANSANYRRVWHPAILTHPPNYLPTEATEPTEVSGARYSPTDRTDVHGLGGYGILPYPRSHQTIFPQKPQSPQKFMTQDILPQIARIRRVWHPAIPTQPPNYLPTEATETTEVSDARYSPTEHTEHTETTGARYSPTDCGYTQIRRVWHPAIPTQPPNYLPTEAYAAKPSVKSVKSVGGSSTPEASVNSVGEPYAT